MARTSRRDLLSAGAVSALVGFAAASLPTPNAQAAEVLPAWPHPDAELIDLCSQIVALERVWGIESDKGSNATSGHPAYIAAYAEMKRLQALQEPILDRLYEMPTHTLDGFRARARAIMAADYGEMERQQDHRGQLYALMHDLVGEVA
ncbi:MAG: hypothetical protein ACRYHQ_03370 [Janthinobacterium lividum]